MKGSGHPELVAGGAGRCDAVAELIDAHAATATISFEGRPDVGVSPGRASGWLVRDLCGRRRTDPGLYRQVVDTVGAGDAFMTGLIDALWDVALLGGHRRDQVRNISTDVLRQVIKVAALSVALTVARPGAALPDRATRDRAANRLLED